MKSLLMLASLGLLLIGSAFTGQANLVGKEVPPKDAALITGGTGNCGEHYVNGHIECNSRQQNCGAGVINCASASFSSKVSDGPGDYELDAPKTVKCFVCVGAGYCTLTPPEQTIGFVCASCDNGG